MIESPFRCLYCNSPVNPNEKTVCQRICGWERKSVKSSRRGGADMILREHVDIFACGLCIARMQQGLTPVPQQETLL